MIQIVQDTKWRVQLDCDWLFLQALNERAKRIFDIADLDKDGKLDMDEVFLTAAAESLCTCNHTVVMTAVIWLTYSDEI